MNINSPNSKMTVAPPMAQMVHTMLAQALFGPPSLSASFARAERQCGQRGDGDGRAERHGEGGGHARPEQPLRQRKTRTRIAPVHGLMPTENTTAIILRQETGPASCRASTM